MCGPLSAGWLTAQEPAAEAAQKALQEMSVLSHVPVGSRMEQTEPGNENTAELCMPVASLLAERLLHPHRTYHPALTLLGVGGLGDTTLHSST